MPHKVSWPDEWPCEATSAILGCYYCSNARARPKIAIAITVVVPLQTNNNLADTVVIQDDVEADLQVVGYGPQQGGGGAVLLRRDDGRVGPCSSVSRTALRAALATLGLRLLARKPS